MSCEYDSAFLSADVCSTGTAGALGAAGAGSDGSEGLGSGDSLRVGSGEGESVSATGSLSEGKGDAIVSDGSADAVGAIEAESAAVSFPPRDEIHPISRRTPMTAKIQGRRLPFF